jgi:hypothetical protein
MRADHARAAKSGIGRQATARKLINHKGHEGTQGFVEVLNSVVIIAFRCGVKRALFKRLVSLREICLICPSCPFVSLVVHLFVGYIQERK